MKGGITSGVVYPEAVVRLAKRYRFCGIGGTSAGAIAAVASAAAEHGRARRHGEKLAEIPGQLDRSVDGDPFILSLFQPEARDQPLFNAAIAFQRGGLGGGPGDPERVPAFPADRRLVLALAARALRRHRPSPWAVRSSSCSRARAVDRLLGVLTGRRAASAAAGERLRPLPAGPARGGPQALTGGCTRSSRISPAEQAGRRVTFADLWGVAPLTGARHLPGSKRAANGWRSSAGRRRSGRSISRS